MAPYFVFFFRSPYFRIMRKCYFCTFNMTSTYICYNILTNIAYKMETLLTEKSLRSAVLDELYWSYAISTNDLYNNAVIFLWLFINYFNTVYTLLIMMY